MYHSSLKCEAEQHRIVAKIDKRMAHCDTLTARQIAIPLALFTSRSSKIYRAQAMPVNSTLPGQ